MYATEFETVINEPYIHIPEYEHFKGHKVKIILLDIENNKDIQKINNKTDNIDLVFDKYTFDISKFKFDREEANER